MKKLVMALSPPTGPDVNSPADSASLTHGRASGSFLLVWGKVWASVNMQEGVRRSPKQHSNVARHTRTLHRAGCWSHFSKVRPVLWGG